MEEWRYKERKIRVGNVCKRKRKSKDRIRRIKTGKDDVCVCVIGRVKRR